MMRFASEDIGNANPEALILASAVQNTVNFLGLPECDTALVQLATYLALSEKDNSAYVAVCNIREDIINSQANYITILHQTFHQNLR